MERYVGVDAHARSCTLVVMSATGQHLRSLVVETNGDALVRAVQGIEGARAPIRSAHRPLQALARTKGRSLLLTTHFSVALEGAWCWGILSRRLGGAEALVKAAPCG